jgi:hypothetical protein
MEMAKVEIKINVTDPESRIMVGARHAYLQSYNAQWGVQRGGLALVRSSPVRWNSTKTGVRGSTQTESQRRKVLVGIITVGPGHHRTRL